VNQDNRPKVALSRRTVMLLTALAAIIAILILFNQLVAFGPGGRKKDVVAANVDNAIGATLEPLDRDTARALGVNPQAGGLVVTSVARAGPAGQAGVRTGDVIERIDRTPVHSIKDAAGLIDKSRNDVTVTLNRHQDYATVHLLIPAARMRHPDVN
jgi:predicted metalloprotease with PDZ domain